jgi:hypothetical protein
MVQPPLSPFAEFISDELQKLCREQRTGTFSVVTLTSILAQFGLNNGEIVSVSVQHKQGLEGLAALEMLGKQGAKVSTVRFRDGHVMAARLALPPTRSILEQLGGLVAHPLTAADPRSVRMTDQVRAVVEQELMEFIGPMAIILCEEVWNAVASLDTALDTLGQELPDPGQAARFRQKVLARIG